MEEKLFDILTRSFIFFQTQEESDAKSAKMITSLFTAFIEWKDSEVGKPNSDGRYLYWEDSFDLDGLFKYWLKNVYGK